MMEDDENKDIGFGADEEMIQVSEEDAGRLAWGAQCWELLNSQDPRPCPEGPRMQPAYLEWFLF